MYFDYRIAHEGYEYYTATDSPGLSSYEVYRHLPFEVDDENDQADLVGRVWKVHGLDGGSSWRHDGSDQPFPLLMDAVVDVIRRDNRPIKTAEQLLDALLPPKEN